MLIHKQHKNKFKYIPDKPGIYLFKDAEQKIIYVGKAASLRRRVFSYFHAPHKDERIKLLVSEIAKIDFKITDSIIEALILEANLIKKHQPKFNIREKDDKSFLYVAFFHEEWPRPILIRKQELAKIQNSKVKMLNFGVASPRVLIFGPFVQASSIRAALRILRKIFPYSTCQLKTKSHKLTVNTKPCFDYQIGLCPGVCAGVITKKEYKQNIKNLILFFRGKKRQTIRNLKKEMELASEAHDFEKAAILRNRTFTLEHIRDTALIQKDSIIMAEDQETEAKSTINLFGRIEGYDISNISGTSAVGSMTVFVNGKPEKDEYRKFKIKTIKGANDIGMMKEVFRRRFKRFTIHNLQFKDIPDLIVVDGGLGQVNAARETLRQYGLAIPVIGIAKGYMRKQDRPIYDKENLELERIVKNYKDLLLQARDEAHRFAISYHRKLRDKLSY